MKPKKLFISGLCVLVALILFAKAIGVMPSYPPGSAGGTACPMEGHWIEGDHTCASAGGHWGFKEDVGIGCFTPDGLLIPFVTN